MFRRDGTDPRIRPIDHNAPTVDLNEDPFAAYPIVRTFVHDALSAAEIYLDKGNAPKAAESLLAAYEMVWNCDDGITWNGADVIDVAQRYVRTRARVLKVFDGAFLPEIPDGDETTDLESTP